MNLQRPPRVAALLPLLLALSAISACTLQPVQPWQRGELAAPGMAWDPDPLLADYRRHALTSKEAASGDTSLGGGGCGCR